ncbi:MAG: SPOR domain-containing protein [Candidatus Riflebacteria bacterium]|nr:SPOR domain-containing protein [Candidatus Riflebacteria bacterium]
MFTESDNHATMTSTRRDFDWGPPCGVVPEKGHEWVVYLLLVFLLAVGGWLLVDSARPGTHMTKSEGFAIPASTHGSFSSKSSTNRARPGFKASPLTTDTGQSAITTGKPGTFLPEDQTTEVSGITDSSENSQSSPEKKASPHSPPSFIVQLGAYVDDESARSTYDHLKADGFTATLASPSEQFEMYRVYLGPFKTEAEAEGLSRRLNELDFPCFVIESP